MNSSTFRLLPSLQFTPHVSGKKRWYAVEDPQSGRFLKLGTAEYLVASGLQNGVSPQQIVAVLEAHGFDNPRQRVTATVAWLAKQGLLLSDSPSAAHATEAEDARPAPKAAVQPRPAFDPFFIRLPLLSGPVVERLAKPIAWLFSWPCAMAFGGLLLAAFVVLVSSSQRFWSLNEKLFVEDGRLWWLVAWFVLKCAHEMGHAAAAVHTGSRIRSAGIHFIFLAPVPYVDVTDLWSITNRRQRVLVSAAGMLAEIVVASLAVLIAMASSSLPLQYLCAALATLGTITTLAFNGNPLMKFDGYYILSDLIGRPNLWTEAQAAASGLIARVVNPFTERLGAASSAIFDPHSTRVLLTAYGLTTMFYRVLMLLTMAWWLLTVWHGIGMMIIAWAVWGWFVRPYYLRRSGAKAALAMGAKLPQAPSANTRRAQLVYGLAMMVIAAGISILPSPRGIHAPGIVNYGQPTTVRAAAEGVLSSIRVSDRQMIKPGELIARMDNPELLTELADARLKHQASLEQANALRARGELALLQAEQAKMESLVGHIEQLAARAEQLELRAPCAGMLLMSLAEKAQGRFIKPGTPICMIVSPDALEVCASASQRDANEFQHHLQEAVAISATGGDKCWGKLVSVDSRGSDQCDQQSLAARYGGPLSVEFVNNAQGEPQLKFPAPRFEIKAELTACEKGQNWVPGQLVWLQLQQRPQRVWQWVWESFQDLLQPRNNK